MGLTLDFFRALGLDATAPINTTSKLMHLQLRGLGSDAAEGSEPVDEAPLLPQLGVLARPVVRSTLRALGVRDGDEVFLLKLWDKAISHATAPQEGETRVYATGAPALCMRLWGTTIEIRVNVSGTLKLAPDASDYAAKPVARKDDAVTPSTDLVTWLTAVGTATMAGPPPASFASIGNGASKVLA